MNRLLVLVTLLVLIGGGGFFWWKNGEMPVNASDKKERLFIIEKGKGVREIANSLKEEKFIRDPIVFFLFIKKEGKDKEIQAGDYRLSSSMNMQQIVDELTHGTLDVWVTFPEGLRAEEYDEILKESNLKSYDNTWKMILVKNNGYLFPDTYLIPKDASIELIASMLQNNFNKKISEIGLNENSKNLDEIVKVASIIEREAKFENDKQVTASVIYNRLKIGMALQVDASVQYAYGYQKDTNSWWKKLSGSDLAIDSPYNTYKNIGLPPKPISNPGIVSLKAAAFPHSTSYLYYVSDNKGKLHFAKTLQEHSSNIKKYLSNQ